MKSVKKLAKDILAQKSTDFRITPDKIIVTWTKEHIAYGMDMPIEKVTKQMVEDVGDAMYDSVTSQGKGQKSINDIFIDICVNIKNKHS